MTNTLDHTLKVLLSEQKEEIVEVLRSVSKAETVTNIALRIISPLMVGQIKTPERAEAVKEASRSLLYAFSLMYMAGEHDKAAELLAEKLPT
jgi:hypothetical protein